MITTCPECNRIATWHECLTEPGARPRIGDATVCAGCGTILHFVAVSGGRLQDMALERLDEKTLNELDAETRDALLGAQRLISKFREASR